MNKTSGCIVVTLVALLASGCGMMPREEVKEIERYRYTSSAKFEEDRHVKIETVRGKEVPAMPEIRRTAYGLNPGLLNRLDEGRNAPSPVVLGGSSETESNTLSGVSDPSKNDFGFRYTHFRGELKKNLFAAHFWGISDHEGQTKGRNERNAGVGGRYYLTDNSFLAADFLRNSQRGRTEIYSLAHEREFLKLGDIRFFAGGALSYAAYEIPARESRRGTTPREVIKMVIPTPGLSVRNGGIGASFLLIPAGKGENVGLMFLTYHF